MRRYVVGFAAAATALAASLAVAAPALAAPLSVVAHLRQLGDRAGSNWSGRKQDQQIIRRIAPMTSCSPLRYGHRR